MFISAKVSNENHRCFYDKDQSDKIKFCLICGIFLSSEKGSTKKFFRSKKMEKENSFFGINSNFYLTKMHKNKSINRYYSKNPNYLQKRKKFINAIKKIINSLSYSQITLYLAVAYVDIIFSICKIKQEEEDLVVFSSLYVASKLNESSDNLIFLDDAVIYLNYNYSKEQLENCEKVIIKHILKFKVDIQTPYNFLNFFLFCGILHNKELSYSDELKNEQLEIFEWCCLVFLEFSLNIYDFYGFTSDFVAATCIFSAKKIFGFKTVWNKDLENLTGIKSEQLRKNSSFLIKRISDKNFNLLSKILKKVKILKNKISFLLKHTRKQEKNSKGSINENSNNLNTQIISPEKLSKNFNFENKIDFQIVPNLNHNQKKSHLICKSNELKNSEHIKTNSVISITEKTEIYDEDTNS